MIKITSAEIAQFRSQLSSYHKALEALDAIEDCEGDLADAALSLAIQIGQEPDSIDFLDGLAKRCRVAICQQEFREDLLKGNVTGILGYLIANKLCPEILATPVLIYVVKTGINNFCEPLQYKMSS